MVKQLTLVFPTATYLPTSDDLHEASLVCAMHPTGIAVPLATSDYSVDPYQCSYGDAGACTYDQTSGFLVGDDNADFCPAQGDFDCAPARRRNARSPLPRSPRPASPAASEPKPQVMKVRAKLGGKRKQVVRK
ncbi:hypothetical protein CC1G_04789 [Coprinopsis cinerea okayama7|uniref:Uncharacterized protein n=1 Tax=Coprinopsis cinerea (strain Okayama-7 / 130 / ATCC MYA-4618 / FGSC 9003) TaxID=240176 RepID=A8P2K6_COPC7|nr:hypothetical protein CC1G_04789 [Coprinopsis cinerea okayama7\|eukprot:XP_001838345.2 hypothetical protein CC1G_04789 [Coprinopsis cinerea okayama7\